MIERARTHTHTHTHTQRRQRAHFSSTLCREQVLGASVTGYVCGVCECASMCVCFCYFSLFLSRRTCQEPAAAPAAAAEVCSTTGVRARPGGGGRGGGGAVESVAASAPTTGATSSASDARRPDCRADLSSDLASSPSRIEYCLSSSATHSSHCTRSSSLRVASLVRMRHGRSIMSVRGMRRAQRGERERVSIWSVVSCRITD